MYDEGNDLNKSKMKIIKKASNRYKSQDEIDLGEDDNSDSTMTKIIDLINSSTSDLYNAVLTITNPSLKGSDQQELQGEELQQQGSQQQQEEQPSASLDGRTSEQQEEQEQQQNDADGSTDEYYGYDSVSNGYFLIPSDELDTYTEPIYVYNSDTNDYDEVVLSTSVDANVPATTTTTNVLPTTSPNSDVQAILDRYWAVFKADRDLEIEQQQLGKGIDVLQQKMEKRNTDILTVQSNITLNTNKLNDRIANGQTRNKGIQDTIANLKTGLAFIRITSNK
jgi:hypothetical protein